jgi:hypothetical protein
MLKTVFAAAVMAPCLAATALAQEIDNAPPQDAKKLSEIVATVEQRSGFRYISDIEWDDGLYEVTYFTVDKAKVEMRFDPVTAEPK